MKVYSKNCYPEFIFWMDRSFSLSFEHRHRAGMVSVQSFVAHRCVWASEECALCQHRVVKLLHAPVGAESSCVDHMPSGHPAWYTCGFVSLPVPLMVAWRKGALLPDSVQGLCLMQGSEGSFFMIPELKLWLGGSPGLSKWGQGKAGGACGLQAGDTWNPATMF